eukprot:1150416-Pelagomonas_calceolata.AAC.4
MASSYQAWPKASGPASGIVARSSKAFQKHLGLQHLTKRHLKLYLERGSNRSKHPEPSALGETMGNRMISAASLPKKTLCTACFCDNNSSNSNRNYHNSNINKGNNKNNTSTRVAAAAVAAAGSTAIEQQQHREIKRPAQAQFSLQIN